MGAVKIYPTNGEYNTSVENLPTFARIPLLRGAVPKRSAPHRLIAFSGGYSRVYPVDAQGRTFALRCWTADVGDARERYRLIGECLEQKSLPYFVEFRYFDDAIMVKGHPYPVLWMEWAAGPRLRDYVGSVIGRPAEVTAVAEAFREMVSDLHSNEISHGDLQDENIIVQPGPGGLQMRLIDYDSLFVPALRGYADQIIGVSHYQHPGRATLRTTSEKVDHFSELVIYLSLLAYAQNPALWNPQHEKRLLFTDADFLDPDASEAFLALRYMTGEVRRLTDCLASYCREHNVAQLPPLEAVAGAPGGSASLLSRGQLPVIDDFGSFLLGAGVSGFGSGAPLIDMPPGFLNAAAPPPRQAVDVAVPGDLLVPPPRNGGDPSGGGTGHPPQQAGAQANTPPPPAVDPWEGFLVPKSRSNWDAFFQGAERSATPPSKPAPATPRKLAPAPQPQPQAVAPPRPTVPAGLPPVVAPPPAPVVQRAGSRVRTPVRRGARTTAATVAAIILLLILLMAVVTVLVGQPAAPARRTELRSERPAQRSDAPGLLETTRTQKPHVAILQRRTALPPEDSNLY